MYVLILTEGLLKAAEKLFGAKPDSSANLLNVHPLRRSSARIAHSSCFGGFGFRSICSVSLLSICSVRIAFTNRKYRHYQQSIADNFIIGMAAE